MSRRLIAFCGVFALLSALDCGNKGPLYQPQDRDAAPLAPQAIGRD